MSCGDGAFHAFVRWAQAGDYVSMDVIGRSLAEFYGAPELCQLKEPCFAMDQLPGDILAYVFSFLSLNQRNAVRLVCKKWASRCWQLNDPRAFTARNVSTAEMAQFFVANSSLTKIGHISPANAVSLFSLSEFPLHRITDLTLVQTSEDMKGFSFERALDFARALPRLSRLSLRLLRSLTPKFVLPSSLRELEIVALSPGAKLTDFEHAHAAKLEVLKIDDGACRDLQTLLSKWWLRFDLFRFVSFCFFFRFASFRFCFFFVFVSFLFCLFSVFMLIHGYRSSISCFDQPDDALV